VILERLAEDLREMAVIESHPKLEGRNMLMLLAPSKKEAAKAEKKAAESAAGPAADETETTDAG
jgi:translation initiation factor IF-3